jgi:hypothetical protein
MSRSFAAILIPKFVESDQAENIECSAWPLPLALPRNFGDVSKKFRKDLVNSVDLRCESIILVIPRDKRTGLMRGAGVLPGSGSSRSWSD